MTKSIYLMKQLKIYFQISETTTFDDRNPSWINSQVKHLINGKNATYKNYLKDNKSNQSFDMFQPFQSQLSSLIANLKNKFYSKAAKRLLDLRTSTKTYWSMVKKCLNNKTTRYSTTFS